MDILETLPSGEVVRRQLLMGDFIGWDRVAELAAERKANHEKATRMRFILEHGGSD